MEDRTISEIQQKNGVLRERLNRLLNEGDGDRTWNGKIGVENTRNGRNGPSKINEGRNTHPVGHRYWDGISNDSNKTTELDKENRQKHFQNFKESVEEIKKRDFALPTIMKGNLKVEKEANVRDYVPNESFTEYDTSLDSNAIKVQDQELIIQKLKEQLERSDSGRRDLIEEFQEKEAAMFKEFRQQEAQLRRESQKRELEIRKDHQTKEEKIMSQLEKALIEKKEQHGKLISAESTETNLKETIKKISVKLVMYKRQINELNTRNEALKSVNRYITQFHQGEVGQKGLQSAQTNLESNFQMVNDPVDAHHHLNFIPEQGSDITPAYIREDDDTGKLIENSDSTTVNLINGFLPDTVDNYTIENRVQHSEQTDKLRKCILAVLFITRLRRLTDNRSRIDKRLQDLALGGSLDLSM